MYRIKDEVRILLTEHGGVVLDIQQGQMLQVNSVAAQILDGLNRGMGVEGVVASLMQTYGVGQETAQRDVCEFMESLQRYRLLRTQAPDGQP